MSDAKKNNKLTPQRQRLVDSVLNNLINNNSIWQQGWQNVGVPISAITGKKYSGVNRLFLTQAMMDKGYKDNRWLTFRQMEKQGWTFKRDAEGNNLGKNAGVPIEYFELRDKLTKKPFDKHTLDGMTTDEKQEYFDENVFPLRKYYMVFNGDIIDGIPERERHELDPSGINERAERLLQYWSENESEFIYGGDEAFYRRTTDKVHMPERKQFKNMPEFYYTSFHEMGHSTGHPTRLNRKMGERFGSDEYAEEELRAEMASMFIVQDLEIVATENHIQNNSAYIKGWYDKINEDPNVLFRAIADADNIAKYILSKEKEMKKNEEPYAIIEETDDYGNSVYKVRMASEYGQTRAVLRSFNSKEELLKEFGEMQKLPYWKDKPFKEVSMEELIKISKERAEEQLAKEGRLKRIEEDKSDVYILPSEIAAKALEGVAIAGTIVAADMMDRGIESLTRMDDRDVVERASKSKYGDKFMSLFKGESVLGDTEKDEQSLMTRLAVFCGQDKEQILRIFKASGQYSELKPNSVYSSMADVAMLAVAKNVERIKQQPEQTQNGKKNRFSSFFKR